MTSKLSGPMLLPKSGATPTMAVVLLHGYGSDGNDLIGLAPYWQDLLPEALFVSPNGPEQCRMLSAGYQWFDIALEGDRLANRQEGVASARPIVIEFLEAMWAQTGITPERTLLGGFSQGAMMALHVGLSLDKPLMGVVGVAGAFFPPEGFGTEAFARPPVCLVHGDMDDVVDPELSADAEVALRLAGYDVSYHVSQGIGHSISPDGLAFATEFIRRVAGK